MKRRKCKTKAPHDGHNWKATGLWVSGVGKRVAEETFWCPGKKKEMDGDPPAEMPDALAT